MFLLDGVDLYNINDNQFYNPNEDNFDNLISLDEYLEQGSEVKLDVAKQSNFGHPERVIMKNEAKELLVKSLGVLTEKEKKVILLYYYEELTLKEISAVLEVSESRISQLHTKAIQKLRLKLGANIELFF